MDGQTAQKKKANKSAKTENIHDGHRQRMREKFLRSGADAFADHELLEILLFYAQPRCNTNEIAHKVLNHFGSLQKVLAAPVEEIAKVEGIGQNSAFLIAFIAPICRRAIISEMKNETILDTTRRLGEFFVGLFMAERSEIMYQLCLDAKGRRLNLFKVNQGSHVAVGLDMREIVANALSCNAAMVVLAHNHPSGVALPSDEDRAGTEQVRQALETINVILADHIIVADNDYISFSESHML